MKIVISGMGVMGASLAQALMNSPGKSEIWGYDKPDILKQAMERTFIHKTLIDWPADCADADIIFLATPINIIKKHLHDLNGIVNKQTIVTDIGSTKSELQSFCRKTSFSGTYVGGHPMTGAEKSGISAANPLLYENATYILTAVQKEHNSVVLNKLIPLLESIKARIFFLDAGIHDKIMAMISHLPQMIAVALMNLVGEKNDEYQHCFELAAGGFRDITRIASSPAGIWQDIIDTNKENIGQALTAFIRQLEKEKDGLNNIDKSFNRANEYRNRIPSKNKGFHSPLTNVLVYVNDQKGVIAKISSSLSNENIDIRDIELLKIREHEGGVFMLSFNNDEAPTAIKVLDQIGYKAFIKE
jgi:prephenate dehydrogenase